MKVRIALLTLLSAALGCAADFDFGPVALAALEDARLNAYCDGSVTPAPCVIQVEFHDVNGRTLKQATLTLQPNTTGSVDFTTPSFSQINPCFKVLRGAALGSFEVFDMATARGHLRTDWSRQLAPRRGDVDFGAGAITPSDTARLGVTCQEGDGSVTPSPCEVTFEFHDANGGTIKQTRLTVQPGTTGLVDLTWQETGSDERRVELQPCFKVARGAAVGTFAILDTLTGFTLTQAYPAALVR